MIAAIQGKTQAVSMLLAKGAAPTLADHSGIIGFTWAARFGHTEVANQIMSAGKHTAAEVDACLEWSARNGQPTLEMVLNAMGTNPKARPAIERAVGQARSKLALVTQQVADHGEGRVATTLNTCSPLLQATRNLELLNQALQRTR